MYWEYTGTSLITFNKVTDKLDAGRDLCQGQGARRRQGSRLAQSVEGQQHLCARHAQGRCDPPKASSRLSDLAGKVKGGEALKLACNAEFYARPDGLAPLQKTYGFEFGRENVVRMDTGLVYQALRDSQVDVGLVFATDGRVPAFDFVILTDDKGFFPNYALTPVVRKETLDKNPKLAEILNALSAKLDDATMAKLNASVDVDKKTVEEVAASFLKAQGVI